MKGLQWSLLQGILLTVVVVLIGMMLVGQVKGFDVTKYFELQPLLGKPGDVHVGDFLSLPPTVVNARCGVFEGWHWSQSPSPIGNPTTVNPDLIIDKFQSPACPSGTIPIVCATHPEFGSLTIDDAKKYGDDAVISIYIDTDNTCIVQARGGNLDKTQARYVGVLCADTATTDVQYTWTDWITTQSISNSCHAGFTPISGMVQSDIGSTANARITILYLNATYAKFYDTSGSNTYNSARKFGTVCVSNNVLNNCGIHNYNFNYPLSINDMVNFKTWYDERGVLGQGEYIAFGEQTCPGDSSLISCGGGFMDQSGSMFMNEFYPYNLEQFGDSGPGGGLDNIQLFPVSTCQLQYSYSEYSGNYHPVASSIVCAENLWHWSDWQTHTGGYGDFSVSCPSGTEAIACASDTDSLESGFDQSGGGSFSEDSINTINFTVNAGKRTGCFIESRDWHSNAEFKRRVGALCIKNSFSGNFIWKTNTFSSSSHSPTITTDALHSCDAGYAPIFCTMQMDPSQDKYREDAITGIDIDPTAGTCSFTLVDPISPDDYQGTIGVLCVNNNPQKVEFPVYKSTNFISSTHANPFYNGSVPCSSGIATTALTVTDSGDQYTEDFLISMVPTSDLANFVVQPYDWYSNTEHSRKVGVVCLDYPKEDFIAPTCSDVGQCFDTASNCRGNGGSCYYDPNDPNNNLGCISCCCIPSIQCTGTAKNCTNFFTPSNGDCNSLQKGCDPAANAACTGTPSPCDGRTQAECGPTTGCIWSSACTPQKTCQSMGYNCGTWTDDCGTIKNCGTCTSGQTCQNNVCAASSTCGASGQPCCASSPQCSSGLTCDSASGTCQAQSACGGSGQSCCSGSSCNSGLVCSGGSCTACGNQGQYCCAGNTCNGGLQCTGAGCVPSLWTFSLSTNPSSGAFNLGTYFSQTVTISITTTSGSPSRVSLSRSGTNPPGVSVSALSQNACTPPCSSTFTMSGTPTVAGDYPIGFSGSATGSSGASASYDLIVTSSNGILDAYASAGGAPVIAKFAIGLGDVDWSGAVDNADLQYYVSTSPSYMCILNAASGSPTYNIDCDMNLDGKINIMDSSIVNANYGKHVTIKTAPAISESLAPGTYALRVKYGNQIINNNNVVITAGQPTNINFDFS